MRLWTSASLFCCLFSLFQSYKILFYCPKNGRSQVIYLGALADILIDAGHDVTFLYSEINPDVSVIGTKRAKSIVIPAAESVKSHFGGDEYIADTWTMKVGNPFAQRKLVIDYAEVIAEQCAHLVENHNSVFEDLKKEKFDILLHEPMDYCQFGIMQAVEIKTHVMIMSAVLMDGIAEAIGASTMPSTVPAWFGNSGEKMTLMERISNAIIMHISKEFTTTLHHKEEDVFRRFLGDKFAPFQDVIDNATYVISNTDPFIDFPRPGSQAVEQGNGSDCD
ncbi:hypothetical protein L596_028460 [Steinernema carpocapsae]|uniref:glucuronosyltransferase n=1 Tax=Steinernema carpocapsae TaxID=34508 RepID=A0A4U5LYI6_STECR|nr:hypothetical protein L596_028460 [Steinernema carpocapsae]